MSNIVEFSASKLPSFLASVPAAANTDLTTGVGSGFPVMSIKGKVFTLVKGGERTTITRPDDPDEAASFLEVILMKANPNTSKIWYEKEFEDGEMGKPDCFSDDGKLPDASIDEPQCKTCAACPRNVFGSARNGKGKSCSDARRVAISAAGQVNEPMLLRIPPATLKPLAEYGKMLNNRGVPYNAVITKIRFEREEATPKLKFEAVRFLTEEEFAEVQDVLAEGIIEDILAKHQVLPGEDAPEIAGTPPKAAKTAPVAPAKPAKPTPTKAAKPAVEPKEEAKEEAKKEAPKKEPIVSSGKSDVDDLDALLAGLDD